MPPPTPIAWTNVRGMNVADPPTRLGAEDATDLHNVLLEPNTIGRRRPSAAAITGDSSMDIVYQVARYQPDKDSSAAQVFLIGEEIPFLGSNPRIARGTSGSWTALTLVPSPTTGFATSRPYAVNYNGKMFVSYASGENRLAVYDPDTSTTALRYVGVAKSAAATVGDTGSGSYTATLRYYKIQFRVVGTSTAVRAASELSNAVSFTPSGSGTAARVTKPATPDSATHWVVFGSADGVTYYDISGQIAVGTTTYDDSAAPSSYSSGTVEPTPGLHIPPPSASYLLADGGRLLMAGARTQVKSPTTTYTLPLSNDTVWFTELLGARDGAGEDESVPRTTDYQAFLTVGEKDGDGITGLGGPVAGVPYVFKQRSVWQLEPTGIPTTPYRATRVSDTMGAISQDAIAVGEDGAGNPAIYFMSLSGPKRIVPGYGVEDLGADVRDYTASSFSVVSATPRLVWDAVRRVLWVLGLGASTAHAFQPQFERRTGTSGVRGGWTRHTITIGYPVRCATIAERDGVLVPWLAGGTSTFGGAVATLSGSSHQDVGTTAIAASATSPVYQPGGPLTRAGYGHPVIEWDYPGAATAISVSVASVIGGPLAVTGTTSDTTTSSTYTTAVVQEKLESVQLSDVYGFQMTVTWDATVAGSERPRIHGVTVPVTPQDPT